MDALKKQVVDAAKASVLDSGKFQRVVCSDIEFGDVGPNEVWITVKPGPHAPRRVFKVKISEVM